MFLRIIHLTRYEYSQPVSFAPHAIYLRPRESPRQHLHRFDLTVSPAARRVATNDAEENALEWAYFAADTFAPTLEFRSESLVETTDTNPFDFFLAPSALRFPFEYNPPERYVLSPFLIAPLGTNETSLRSWLDVHLPSPPQDTVAFISALNTAVHQSLNYRLRQEPGIQNPTETLACNSGSCRDYAVFFIALCRTLGLAARFVSGYLYEPAPPGVTNPVPPDMHAWTEIYLPGAGWRGVDPTRGIFCDDRFVPVAHSAISESVNPIQGTFYGPTTVSANLVTQLTLDRS
jgi:transglutaminase-like putative cysteine protease